MRRVDGSGFISVSSGKPVALFPFRDGDMVCQKSVTEAKTHAVGVALGHIHHAGSVLGAARLGELAGESRFGREALRARLVRVGETTTDPEILQVRDELERFLREPYDEPRVIGLIHGDVFRDNVLWQNARIAAVLDFESASIGSLAFDLMVTVLAWCFASELQQPLARALVAGYRESAPLDRALANELFDAGRFACARFTTTRITDFELRPRGATVYKDFRRWKRRMEQLEALGPVGLSALLDLT
jgi:homoserine kinase type II